MSEIIGEFEAIPYAIVNIDGQRTPHAIWKQHIHGLYAYLQPLARLPLDVFNLTTRQHGDISAVKELINDRLTLPDSLSP